MRMHSSGRGYNCACYSVDQFLQASGSLTKYIDLPEVDHFNIIEQLEDPNYTLTKVIIKWESFQLPIHFQKIFTTLKYEYHNYNVM